MRTLISIVAIVTGLTPAPAVAEPSQEGSADHTAGSQILKHEGTDAPRTGESPPTAGKVPGMDVSSHQGDVDWREAWEDGARFAYVKATEGTHYRNPRFTQQYDGSYRIGMIRGAYHFALPDRSGGAEQASFFVGNGGGWSPDGRTLPPALDLEYNPYGEVCYGMDQKTMTAWVKSFSDEVVARTGRHPTIYTSTTWWNRCVGGSVKFGDDHPLWIAHYSSKLGPLPAGFDFHTIWQWQAEGVFPGDQNLFNGAHPQLQRLAAS
ncbi:Lyzozyme M1 (1,4-beta-N-acetylmuramidase), GH25 family [Lentzea fradiae]|uniref:Lysozyme n=1 Tax=Lentzea fradiae TaxID=200378 RepID=A0A1G7MC29_9PSEU|nr:lysozyme [Lentzea fradiae]SDF59358.1 Lyzozyme M1 (1,4-beta-N-acetylmuramidase), GH25 family [Lentzea fradiae]